MTSLPKRGDRVRVTWAHQHSSLKVGSEVVLSSHGYSVDPANELYRPTPPPDCVSFMYADGHRERGSHAVKVEILERASGFDCCGGSDEHPPEHTQDCSSRQESERVCADCGLPVSHRVHRGFGPCGCRSIKAVHPEFARGMRRAVEIARPIAESYGLGMVASELSDAIEKELADG